MKNCYNYYEENIRFEDCGASNYWSESYYFCEEQEPDWDEEYFDEEYCDSDLEMGFDPYEGCYTYDC